MGRRHRRRASLRSPLAARTCGRALSRAGGAVTGGPDPDAFAALICDWCLGVEAGQRVVVSSTTLAEPLGQALHTALLGRDAWPFIWLVPPSLTGDVYRHGGERHRSQASPWELDVVTGLDCFVRIDAPAN